jgi:hypothetical protein
MSNGESTSDGGVSEKLFLVREIAQKCEETRSILKRNTNASDLACLSGLCLIRCCPIA